MNTDPIKTNSVVYKVTIVPTNKFYIGSTCDIYRRLRDHFNGKQGSNIYLANAVAKYGIDNVEVTLLKVNLTREEAYKLEQRLLDEHYNDPLNMNFSSSAKGVNTRCNPSGPKCEEVYIGEKLSLDFITKKEIKKKFPFDKLPSDMTTREYKEWYKNNKPDKYAIKEPNGTIIYLKYGELTSYCKEHGIPQDKLHTKGYCNSYFFTKDLSKKGIASLKKAKYKNNKGNSKLYKVYKEGVYLETITNLTQWCKEKGLNYTSANNRVRGIVKSDYNGYNFELI